MYRALLGVSKVFVLIEKAMYRTLLVWLNGFQMFVLIANAMYRTLLATCGSAEMLAH